MNKKLNKLAKELLKCNVNIDGVEFPINTVNIPQENTKIVKNDNIIEEK